MAKKILVIDDEEMIIKSLEKLLEKNGYEVFVVKNGQDAIVMAEEETFDLLIADIRIPGISGVEAVEQIYKNSKGRVKIPAIFITGYADDLMEKKAQKLSPVGYILKPFDTAELLNKIRSVIG